MSDILVEEVSRFSYSGLASLSVCQWMLRLRRERIAEVVCLHLPPVLLV